MTELPRKITDDPYGAAALIRRLVNEQGLQHWAALRGRVRPDGHVRRRHGGIPPGCSAK